jgi:type II secretory pathway pseudopilin PulG
MGTSFAELLMVIAVALIMIVSVVMGLQVAREGNNISTTIQGLYILRTNIDQLYTGSDYSGLDNSVVISAELAPKTLIRNNTLRSSWGPITVSSSDGSTYNIELEALTKKACQQMGRLSPDSWGAIEINGSGVLDVDTATIDVSALTSACSSNSNTVVFTTLN